VKVTVIVTVLNEGKSIRRLLDSLAAQTRLPDEVVVVDGGSTDETVSILEAYVAEAYVAEGRLPLRVISCPGTNISQGRNVAIAAATGEIVASTDAGVRLSPDWLAALLDPFEGPHADGVAVVGGFFLPDPRTEFETTLGATTLPAVQDIVPERFLPSSRSVAYRKAAAQAVGGYPEWLDYCEDLVFDFKLRERYGPFSFAPRAVAYFRPRPNLRAFVKQYYRYARGDGKAGLWLRRHLIRYLTYLVASPLLVALALLHSSWWGIGFLVGGMVMFGTPFKRLWPTTRGWSLLRRLRAFAWVPVIRVAGDVAKMVGYPAGMWWRLRYRGGRSWRKVDSRCY
jgi:glycosyltransferase involved in cell wall biosynthesis